ncbi:DUF6541 family protein [Saccharomonospora iraqiensis]|uniref:DUF6541 family protein n=1 Tax=Saccharomonospora iraqiensis TaxID=52698 RepID=UPI00022E4633|nr:DUF6541 family protein [Saccharomonospora iraqiensis]
MSWWQLVPTLLWTAAIVLGPGYLVVRSWGLSGLMAVGTSAGVSVSLISVSAVLAPVFGQSWGAAVVAVPTVLLALTGLVLRRIAPGALGVRDTPRRPLRARWTLFVHAAALLVPAVLLTRGLVRLIGAPDNIAQVWDTIFHLNAVRYILDTGSGSSLTLGGMYSDGAEPSLYPGAWHDLVSLVVQLSDVSIPVATSAVTLVLCAVVWPISMIFLVTRVTGVRPVPVLFAGALSAVFGAFPYQILYFGVLYPFVLSLALLPVGLGLVAMVAGVGTRDRTPRWLAALALTGVVPGLALAHPSTVLALGLFAVPILVVAVVRYVRSARRQGTAPARLWVVAALPVGYVAALVVLWDRVRPSAEGSHWAPIQSSSQAIGQVLAAGTMELGPTWVVLMLTLVAIGLVLRRQLPAWVTGIYLLAAAGFVVASGWRDGVLRDFVTGVWYNDPHRLAAQLPMATILLCTLAAVWLFGRSWDTVAARRSTPPADRPAGYAATPAVSAVALLAAVLLAVSGQYSSVNYALGKGGGIYRNSDMLSESQRTLLERLDRHVPADATIIGNPWTGTAFAYALGDRRTLTPHLSTPPEEIEYLMDNLHKLRFDPKVCSLVEQRDAYYVLDFAGRQYLHRGVHFPGLVSLRTNPGLTEIDQEGGSATLYRITGC